MSWKRDESPKTGFRANANQSGTTPGRDWRNYPSQLPAIIARLQGVVIENRAALELLDQFDQAKPGTLVYADPPYLPETRDAGSDYRHEMTEQDHIDLAARLRRFQGTVIVSGYPSKLYEELYQGWHREEFAALADGARPRSEVLWMNHQKHNRLL